MFKTEKEVFSQHIALKESLQLMRNKESQLEDFFDSLNIKGITFTGCGSSFDLCISAAKSASRYLNLFTNSIAAGDLLINFSHYRKQIENTLLITPTRSGSTSEVIMAVEKAKKESDVKCLGISAVENSPLSKLSDFIIEIPWAFDNSVSQTRTVTNLYFIDLYIIAIFSKNKDLQNELEKAVMRQETLMNAYNKSIKDLVDKNSWRNVIILADSELTGIGKEAALAFNEISMKYSNYHHILDVRHGPMSLINQHTLVVLACSDEDFIYQRALIDHLTNRGACVVTVSSKDEEWKSDLNIKIDKYYHFGVYGIPFIFVAQALSLYTALNEGGNPDAPDGLDPWIKL